MKIERSVLIRSIKQQFNYCISKSTRIGQSKHSAKKAGTYKAGKLYGQKTIDAYRDTAQNFSNWLAQKCPEVKQVVDITPAHVQAWIDDRAKNWTTKTLENHLTRIKYLEQQAQRAYGVDKVHFYSKDITRPATKEAVRTKAMSREDFSRLQERMAESRSFAKDALEITSRIGARVDEVAHLKREDINIEARTIYISPEGAKNGRARTVPIREKDLPYFQDLLERYPTAGYLSQITAQSIDKAIRRYMADTKDKDGIPLSVKYPKQTEHAIRKMYATERMQQERGSEPLADRKEELKHWDTVSHELGHGDGREALYKVYCKG